MTRLIGALAATALLAAACARSGPLPPPASAPPATVPAAQAPPCGRRSCTAGEFCEERFKGHAQDEMGRPLEREKCMPLPDACRDDRSCACVTRHVSARRCTDEGGRVRLDDYPR